jgi:SAM-dependent methyltransferase
VDELQRFYDDFAAHYHLLFADWDAAVHGQGETLNALIAKQAGPGPKRLLDCACGIGTQAIGLALRGHQVTGSDISPAAIERAKREAKRLGASCRFVVADLRRLQDSVKGGFELAVAFDNALPHFMSNLDLDAALTEIAEVLRPRGMLLASIRDYDELRKERPRMTPPRLIEVEGERRVHFQVWDWAADGASYRPTLYFLRDRGGELEALAFPTQYRALTRDELTSALERAGFRSITWIEPAESGYYQPVVAAGLK